MKLYVCVLACLVALSIQGRAQSVAPARQSTASASAAGGQPRVQTASRTVTGDGRLAVRRVVLYKNGIGFFEHVGRVVGNQDVSITFTSAQLDDALKSLTALDLGKGQIAGITYNSTAPLAQRLSTVSFRPGDKGDRAEFFRAIRGAELEVRTRGATFRGRLVSIDQHDPVYGSTPEAQTALTLVSATGQVSSLQVGADAVVRLLDRDLTTSVGQYLALIADEHRRDERRVSIATRGVGARDLYVSYVSEVPVWKSTYRLLMPGEGHPSPVLQGWAVVDNTVGEDWVDVEMALVAGAPQSFVQRLSQPYYLRRPVVAPPVAMQLVPQTHDGGFAARGLEYETTGGVSGGTYARTPPPPPAAAQPPIQESVTVTAASPIVDTSTANFTASDIEAEMVEQLPAASGRAVGELFEYTLAEKVTVRKNQSALVPIVRAEVGVERVSLWNDSVGAGRPLRAVWLTNSTGLTLDGGTVSIVDGGAFAGEGTIEALVPGEKRLVSYARDLSMAVDARSEPDRRQLVRLRASDGFVIEQRETCGLRTYTVRNDDRAARTIVIEHPRREGWTLVEGTSASESTSSAHRFRVSAPSTGTSTLVVREVYSSQLRVDAAQLTVEQLNAYASVTGIGQATTATLRPLLELRDAASRADVARAAKEHEASAIRAEQGHVRQNMGALKGSDAEKQLLQRYVRQLDDQETRLTALAGEMAEATKRATEARSAFDIAVKALVLDATVAGSRRCQ